MDFLINWVCVFFLFLSDWHGVCYINSNSKICKNIDIPTIFQYTSIILKETNIYNDINPLVVAAIIWHESHLNPKAIGPNKKDIGLMQISYIWVKETKNDLKNPEINIKVGISILNYWKNERTKSHSKNYLAHYAAGNSPEKKHFLFQKKIINKAKKFNIKEQIYVNVNKLRKKNPRN
ncbi:transglycosylase SLT domain-containing protein [Candidatus Pacearchaeota archaeon]|nr:transglycosylase SLT domain-containing protein [Candidatus Pacearchaeota archaeon]